MYVYIYNVRRRLEALSSNKDEDQYWKTILNVFLFKKRLF